jgi:transcriptional regulator with XRE-family HTH domain
MTKLAQWMEATGTTDEALAASVRVDRSTISRIRRGKHEPSLALIKELVKLSGGKLSADDLLGLQSASEAA